MIGRVAGVVAVQRHRGKAGKRPQKLRAGYGRRAERCVGGDLAEVRILDLLRELRAEAELLGSELIEVDIGHTQPGKLRAEVAEFDAPVTSERPLQTEVPLLRVAAAVVPLHAKDSLAEA